MASNQIQVNLLAWSRDSEILQVANGKVKTSLAAWDPRCRRSACKSRFWKSVLLQLYQFYGRLMWDSMTSFLGCSSILSKVSTFSRFVNLDVDHFFAVWQIVASEEEVSLK